LYWPQDNVLL